MNVRRHDCRPPAGGADLPDNVALMRLRNLPSGSAPPRSARRSDPARYDSGCMCASAACVHPPIAGTEARIYSSHREHHMANIFAFFSTRTLLQIIFVLGSAVAMKAWSLGLLFGG